MAEMWKEIANEDNFREFNHQNACENLIQPKSLAVQNLHWKNPHASVLNRYLVTPTGYIGSRVCLHEILSHVELYANFCW